MPRVTRLVAILLVACPSIAWAQPPASSLVGLQNRIRLGASVVVTDRDGRETRGRVRSLSPESLELVARDAARHFVEAEIALIEQRRSDTPLDGLAIGAGVSVGVITAFALIVCGDCDFGDHTAEILGIYGLIGGTIGLLVDASIRELHPIYIAGLKTSPSKATLTISPFASRRGGGAALSLRF